MADLSTLLRNRTKLVRNVPVIQAVDDRNQWNLESGGRYRHSFKELVIIGKRYFDNSECDDNYRGKNYGVLDYCLKELCFEFEDAVMYLSQFLCESDKAMFDAYTDEINRLREPTDAELEARLAAEREKNRLEKKALLLKRAQQNVVMSDKQICKMLVDVPIINILENKSEFITSGKYMRTAKGEFVISQNRLFDNKGQLCGNKRQAFTTIDYCMLCYGMSFTETVRYLVEWMNGYSRSECEYILKRYGLWD